MAAITCTADIHDTRDEISITTGGIPGDRGITVIIDDSKVNVHDSLHILNTLHRIADAYRARIPHPTS